DLVLFDLGLPKLNGIESARQVHAHVPHARILFMSQESSTKVVEEAFRLGALGYVHKQDVPTDLFPAIDTVLSGQRFGSRSVEAGSESTDRIVLQENQDQATRSDFHFSEGAILETLELAMNQIGVVTRCSRDFRYLWVNQRFADSIQLPLDKIIGRPMSE